MYEYSIERESIIKAFVKYRIAANRWNLVSEKNLVCFDRYCSRNFPDTYGINQQMLDGWCKQRETEAKRSFIDRCYPVIQLVKYLIDRGDNSISVPEMPTKQGRNHIPHIFSEEELISFFNECDRRVKTASTKEKAFRALTIAVMFRLLYSSGMRTTEARLLNPSDIDFENAVINIRKTKGDIQHYVALHNDTVNMLRSYELTARRFYPKRAVFFPGKGGESLSPSMLGYEFHKVWDSISKVKAVPYDFRHNYAVTNINTWIGKGFEFHDKFLYLSKSMGHTSLESTKYYYSLAPVMADILNNKSGEGFNSIVPEVIPYEQI